MPAWPPRVRLPAACQASNSSEDMWTPSEKSCAGRRGAALHTPLFFLTVLVAACAGSMRRFPDTIKADSHGFYTNTNTLATAAQGAPGEGWRSRLVELLI